MHVRTGGLVWVSAGQWWHATETHSEGTLPARLGYAGETLHHPRGGGTGRGNPGGHRTVNPGCKPISNPGAFERGVLQSNLELIESAIESATSICVSVKGLGCKVTHRAQSKVTSMKLIKIRFVRICLQWDWTIALQITLNYDFILQSESSTADNNCISQSDEQTDDQIVGIITIEVSITDVLQTTPVHV